VEHYLKTGEKLVDPSIEEQYKTLVEHLHRMFSHYGHETGVRMARKHIAWYSKGFPGSAEFRSRVNQLLCSQLLLREVHEFYAPHIYEPVLVQ